jgi:maltose O-acetyltransferase
MDSRSFADRPLASRPTPGAGWLQRKRSYFWGVFNALQRMPVVPLRWRMQWLRRAGCQLAPGAEIREDVFIGSPALTMAAGTYINCGCFLDGSAPIVLGEHVRIGPHVKLLTGSHTYAPNVIRRGPGSIDIRQGITIERGCWVGMGTLVMPGVVIAEGCVIAAGSVLLASTAPNGLYAGNPARRVRDLPTG